jgi:hypothetical protein
MKSPDRIGRKIVKGAAVLAVAGAAFGLSGCSGTSSSEASSPEASETTAAATAWPTTPPVELSPSPTQSEQEAQKSLVELADEYIASEDRNNRIKADVDAFAAQIVALAESGEIGYFGFYNTDTGAWGRGAGNAGLGQLQHNPQYGGSNAQVNVGIRQNEDGSFDLGTVTGVSIVVDGPDGTSESFDIEQLHGRDVWSVITTTTGSDGAIINREESGDLYPQIPTADDLEKMENGATGRFAEELGKLTSQG